MSDNPFETYDISEPPFDEWVEYPSDVINDEQVLDALDLEKDMIPRFRCAVLHQDYTDHLYDKVGDIIRVEARVGNNGDIGDRFNDSIDTLLENSYYKYHRFGDDPTYVKFYFEVPSILEPILDELD